MPLPPVLAEIALAASPFAAARVIAWAPRGSVRAAVAGLLALFGLICVCAFGVAPPIPATGVWAVAQFLRLPAAELAGLALVATSGTATWLTARAAASVARPRDLLLTCVAMTAIAPAAILGLVALIGAPAVALVLTRRAIPPAANDNHPPCPAETRETRSVALVVAYT